MYRVVNASTQTIVSTFMEKRHALGWAEDNNIDEKGDYMHLYDVVNDKDASRKRQNALRDVETQ